MVVDEFYISCLSIYLHKKQQTASDINYSAEVLRQMRLVYWGLLLEIILKTLPIFNNTVVDTNQFRLNLSETIATVSLQ